MLIPAHRRAGTGALFGPWSGAILLGSALSFATSAASAQSAPEPGAPVELAYEAAPPCPEATRFKGEVEARLARTLTWGKAPGSRQLDVRVSEDANGFRAALRVVSPTGAVSDREFSTANCDDAVVALAVVAALSIDPAASVAPGSALSRAEQETGAPPGDAETPVAPPAPVPASPPTSAPPPQKTAAVPRAQAVERTPERPRPFRVDVGPAVAFDYGSAPVVLLAAGIQGGLSLRSGVRFELVALAARTGVVSASTSDGTFTRIVARTSACPLRYPTGGALFVRPCLTTEVGWMTARSAESPDVTPQTGRSPILATGPTLQGTYEGPLVTASLTLGPLVNIIQNTYVLENPDRTVHESADVDWAGHAGVGITF